MRPSVEEKSGQLKEMLPVFEVLKGKLLATDIDQEALARLF